jgi:hypothetical protein
VLTMKDPNPRETGLRILGRMIVRAYLGEIARGEAGPAAENEAMFKHAGKRHERDYDVSLNGEDEPIGKKENISATP